MTGQLSRTLFDEDHDAFRAMVRDFVAGAVVPNLARWAEAGIVDREFYREAGRLGLLGPAVPEACGGGGVDDFRYSMIIAEELCRVGATAVSMGLGVFNDLVAPYLCTIGDHEQRRRGLPGACAGETLTAIAMSEPGAGGDLRGIRSHAVRDGDDYVLNGTKTFISNGILADLVIVAAKTTPPGERDGISLFVVERDMPGFARGRRLAKLFTTELQQTVVRRCLQLYGGYGYMREYPIAGDLLDARATTLFAGTSEVMKEIIARSLR